MLHTRVVIHVAYYAKKFIVGLTNVHPQESRPTLWNYTLCGQYPGAVPAGVTVSVYCPYNLPPFRYVIVQSPITSQLTNTGCDRQPPSHPASHVAVAITLNAKASSLKTF